MSPLDALQALIAAMRSTLGHGITLPATRAEVVTWCLVYGVRLVKPMTLMALALYHEPRAAFVSALLSDPLQALL